MTPGSSQAFTQAERHTKRVRRLRWLLPALSLALALLFAGVSYVRSFLARVEMGPLHLEGNALILQQPKIAGVDKHQHAYEVIAQSARQSINEPRKVELLHIEAKMQLVDDGWARITSDQGLLDDENQRVSLNGNIHVVSSHGYDMHLENLQIDTKAGNMSSDRPVTAQQGESRISAERLNVTNSGEVIRFEGKVRAELNGQPAKDTP